MNGSDNLPIGPGFLGFVAVFVLALALWLLMRNMNARMRRMAYRDRDHEHDHSPGPGDDGAGPVEAGPAGPGARAEVDGTDENLDDPTRPPGN